MKDLLLLASLWMFTIQAVSQKMSYDNNRLVQLSIVTKTVIVSKDFPELALEMKLVNKSNKSFIFYGFKRIEDATSAYEILHAYMSADVAVLHGGFAIDNENHFFSLGIPDLEERMSLVQSHNLSDSVFNDTLKKTVVVGAGKTADVFVKIKLKKDKIPPVGEYRLFTMYNCGINIDNAIPPSIMRDEEIKNLAVTYKGYIKSDTVRLVVK